MLGDGSVIENLMAPGHVSIGDQTKRGHILLDETSNDVLVGMGLLRTFKLGLILTTTVVAPYDEQLTFAAVADLLNTSPRGEATK